MRCHLTMAVAALIALATSAADAADSTTCNPPDDLAVVTQATELRELGPAGLKQALAEYDKLVERRDNTEIDDQQRARIEGEIAHSRRVVELVAQQRSAHVSRLFWHTDLDEALAASGKTNKPVLSLRMLGKLTDEYSCANSRFFRTTLYANEQIRETLGERFILHWQSVRPVPVVTIDFGDGRKLERTITGNSAHYVLDQNGTSLDALPGLYSPAAFAAWLDRTAGLFESYHFSKAPPESQLAKFHESQLQAIDRQIARDLEQLHEEVRATFASSRMTRAPGEAPRPTAAKASRVAVGKRAAEAPLVRATEPASRTIDLGAQADNEPLWQAIAALHHEEAKLDRASIELIRSEQPIPVQVAARRAESKTLVEDPLVRMLRQFESSLALDTVRNEYLLHRQIHAWFAEGSAPAGVESLNNRVYAELFLTPPHDPWMGLAPPDTYTGLREGGLRVDDASATVAR